MAETKRKQRLTASDVRAALALRFKAPAWALFEEVGNATGFACRRHADAVAVSLWPSRGLEIQGIEVKVARSDWQKELDDPAKADAIAQYCDRWWVAAAPDVVRDGELPPTWGLLVLKGGKLHYVKEAPKLEAKALDRRFVAALLRRAHEGIGRVKAAAFSDGFEKGKATGPEEHQRQLSNVRRELELLKTSLREFEERSGVRIESWQGGSIGDAVKRVLQVRSYGSADPTQYLRWAKDALEMRARQIDESIEELEAITRAAQAAE